MREVAWRLGTEERADLVEEVSPRRFALEEHVVLALQRDETRARNERRESAARLEVDHRIAPRVQDECRHIERSGLFANVDAVRGFFDAKCVLYRERAREVTEPLPLFRRSLGEE